MCHIEGGNTPSSDKHWIWWSVSSRSAITTPSRLLACSNLYSVLMTSNSIAFSCLSICSLSRRIFVSLLRCRSRLLQYLFRLDTSSSVFFGAPRTPKSESDKLFWELFEGVDGAEPADELRLL